MLIAMKNPAVPPAEVQATFGDVSNWAPLKAQNSYINGNSIFKQKQKGICNVDIKYTPRNETLLQY